MVDLRDILPSSPLPSFSFDPNAPAGSPLSYQALQSRRKIAEALLGKRSPFPKTLGEGLTYVGERLGDAWDLSRLDQADRADQANLLREQQQGDDILYGNRTAPRTAEAGTADETNTPSTVVAGGGTPTTDDGSAAPSLPPAGPGVPTVPVPGPNAGDTRNKLAATMLRGGQGMLPDADPYSVGAGETSPIPIPAGAAGVNPKLAESVQAGADNSLPPGYSMAVTSGTRQPTAVRPGGYHPLGQALDVRITGPQGPVPNTGDDPTGLYRGLARGTLDYARDTYPNMVGPNPGQIGWGGEFDTAQGPNKTGQRDLMHFDLGGRRGAYTDKSFFGDDQDRTGAARGYGTAAGALRDANTPQAMPPVTTEGGGPGQPGYAAQASLGAPSLGAPLLGPNPPIVTGIRPAPLSPPGGGAAPAPQQQAQAGVTSPVQQITRPGDIVVPPPDPATDTSPAAMFGAKPAQDPRTFTEPLPPARTPESPQQILAQNMYRRAQMSGDPRRVAYWGSIAQTLETQRAYQDAQNAKLNENRYKVYATDTEKEQAFNRDAAERSARLQEQGLKIAGATPKQAQPRVLGHPVLGPDYDPTLGTKDSSQRTGVPDLLPTPAGVSPEDWQKSQIPTLAAAITTYKKAAPKFNELIDVIDKLQKHPGKEQALGLGANAAPAGSAAEGFKALYSQLEGKIFLQAYGGLKEGGGAGNIANVEGEKATAAIGALSRAQSKKDFDDRLIDLRTNVSSDFERLARAVNQPVTAWGKWEGGPAPDLHQRVQASNGSIVEYMGGNPKLKSSWQPVR